MAAMSWWLVGAFGSDLGCEYAPGTSLYGESSLSVVPPGRVCTHEVIGDKHVDAPDPARVLVLAFAVAGGVTLALDRRRAGALISARADRSMSG